MSRARRAVDGVAVLTADARSSEPTRLSDLLGRTLRDVVVGLDAPRPVVRALVSGPPARFDLAIDELLLGRDVLDTQVVDIVGKRIARVSDVFLTGADPGRAVVVAVDVGFGSVCRRLGLHRLAVRLGSSPIDWADLHLTSARAHRVQLDVGAASIHRLTSDELATVLSRLKTSAAAEVLAAVSPKAAAAAVEATGHEVAGRLVAAMPAEHVDPILHELPAERAGRLRRARQAVRSRRMLRHRPKRS